MRPLSPSQLQLLEFAIRSHVITIAPTQTFEDCSDPSFWANVADRMRVCDLIYVFSARNDFFAELIVRTVAQGSAVRGSKGGVRVQVLRYVELDPLERPIRPVEHKVEFRGPAELWCVIRNSDGAIVKSHLDTREMAERHIATMAVAMV